jgi:predicted ATPase
MPTQHRAASEVPATHGPTAPLLERAPFLETMSLAVGRAREGHGSTIVVSGEAGIGKTTLVEHFLATMPDARVLWGACEALFTPHALGPLHDMARSAGGRLRAALGDQTDRASLFATVLDELSAKPGPVLLVIDDLHWADAATLDLVKFLGRRVHRVSALLVLTCRDDETSYAQLCAVLAELPAQHVQRIVLPPLSATAVDTLAAHAERSIAGLHALTGGNPFFVTELLCRRRARACRDRAARHRARPSRGDAWHGD